jgi:hypothetical protein
MTPERLDAGEMSVNIGSAYGGHCANVAQQSLLRARLQIGDANMIATSAEETPADGSFFVITFCSSGLPMAVRVPFVDELVGFSVFRSRTVDEGRERFRLHVGYFESAARARDALAVVRRYHPAAFIAAAPHSNLGSLDDTLSASFQVIKSTHTRIVTDATRRPVEPPATTPQHYVVHLVWSAKPLGAESVPRLAAFRRYNTYSVRVLRDGSPQHGLRLGFFDEIAEAQYVAECARPHYPLASVLPVSEREYTRAIDLLHERVNKALTKVDPPKAGPTGRVAAFIARATVSR